MGGVVFLLLLKGWKKLIYEAIMIMTKQDTLTCYAMHTYEMTQCGLYFY